MGARLEQVELRHCRNWLCRLTESADTTDTDKAEKHGNKKSTKAIPSWSDVKTRLVDFDRAGLLGLIQDLYAASKDNKAFLHARFALGDDFNYFWLNAGLTEEK